MENRPRSGMEAILLEPVLIHILLDKLPKERFENQLLILECLYRVLRAAIPLRHVNPQGGVELARKLAVLQTDADFHLKTYHTVVTFVHPHFPTKIKVAACQCLAALFSSDPLELWVRPHAAAGAGATTVAEDISNNMSPEENVIATTVRKEALQSGVIGKLMILLRTASPRPSSGGSSTKTGAVVVVDKVHVLSQRTSVQAAAMLALMAMTVDVEAKKSIVREGGSQLCMDVLNKCVGRLCPALASSDQQVTRDTLEEQMEHQDVQTLLLNTLKVGVEQGGGDLRVSFSTIPTTPIDSHTMSTHITSTYNTHTGYGQYRRGVPSSFLLSAGIVAAAAYSGTVREPLTGQGRTSCHQSDHLETVAGVFYVKELWYQI